MPDNKYNVTDLISQALEQKPVEFETTFSSLLKDRLRDAVELKKQEVASSMFNKVQDEEPEDDVEEPEENEEEETDDEAS